MNDFDSNDDVRNSMEKIKVWLNNYKVDDVEEPVTINAPEGLKAIGFPDFKLEKLELQHQEGFLYGFDTDQKPLHWTELGHLLNWTSEFQVTLLKHRSDLITLELIRGLNEHPISLAKFHYDEAVAAVTSAVNLDLGLDLQHPDTRGHNYAVQNIFVDESNGLQDIIRQIFACLFTRCLVRLVVKKGDFYSSVLSAYLVDLMHESEATKTEIRCLAFDRRDSLGNEKFTKCIASGKRSKLSNIAIVFKQTDHFAAAQGIIESYFREQYPNLIVLVEEAAYDCFITDWQRYYSHALHIGSRLDYRTVVVDSFNSKVEIDLAAIDVKTSHKMTGNVINVLKFRTISELLSLLSNFRKVPQITIWQDNMALARELTSKVNICSEYWFNHIPRSLANQRFPEDMLNYYLDSVSDDMVFIYNSLNAQFLDDLEQLKKIQSVFVRKDNHLKTSLIIKAFVSLVTKSKSLRNGSSVREVLARLTRFQSMVKNCRMSSSDSCDSRVETQTKPVGLAVMLVRYEIDSIKSKAVLVEAIFKNLLIGNAVLLICPNNTLGVKFNLENDHIIPFKMVHETPDLSKLSLEESNEACPAKKQCPKNVYAFEVLADMTNESLEAITVSLGTRRKHIWYPNAEQANYWLDKN